MYALAFLTGFAGSLHCAGMCGPISIVLGSRMQSLPAKIAGTFAYNVARSLAYALVSLLPALVGFNLQKAGLMHYIALFSGALLILAAIPEFIRPGFIQRKAGFSALSGWVRDSSRPFYRNFSFLSFPALGFLNGFLPCGLLYSAVLMSITAGSPMRSALFVFLFGMGTWPVMIAVYLFGNTLLGRIREKLKYALALSLLISGVLIAYKSVTLLQPPAQNTITECK